MCEQSCAERQTPTVRARGLPGGEGIGTKVVIRRKKVLIQTGRPRWQTYRPQEKEAAAGGGRRLGLWDKLRPDRFGVVTRINVRQVIFLIF